MKKLLFFALGSAFLVSLFFLGGCNLKNTASPTYSEYAIQVDSIQYPDTISAGQSLNVKFYGNIGPNTSYSFSRFVGGVSPNGIGVAVYGKYLAGQSNVVDSTQYLDGKVLTVTPNVNGNFIIHVYQPNPPDIFDTVYITPPTATSAH